MIFKKIIISIVLVFCGFLSEANQTCSAYLTSGPHVFLLQADNYNSKLSLAEMHWSMLEASVLDVEVQKYLPQIIEFVFKHNDVSLDDKLKGLYTFVGAPKIQISIKFKPDGDVFSGSLKYIGTVYNNRTEMHNYYINRFGSVESAYFAGAIRPEDTLPWNTTFYFVGSHEDDSSLYP